MTEAQIEQREAAIEAQASVAVTVAPEAKPASKRSHHKAKPKVKAKPAKKSAPKKKAAGPRGGWTYPKGKKALVIWLPTAFKAAVDKFAKAKDVTLAELFRTQLAKAIGYKQK